MSESPEELQQRIAAYIDGQLPPAEAARLEVYLANTNPALADSVIGMLSDKVQIKALPRPHAPLDLSARIMEQIERGSLLNDVEHLAGPQRPWWQSRIAVAAGLVLVLGGFTYFITSSVIRRGGNDAWMQAAETSRRTEIAKAPDASKGADRTLAMAEKAAPALRDADLSKDGRTPAAAPLAFKSEALPAASAPMAKSLAEVDNVRSKASDALSKESETQIASAMPTPGAIAANQSFSAGQLGGGGGGGAGGGARAIGGRGGSAPASPVISAGALALAATPENTTRTLDSLTRRSADAPAAPVIITLLANDDQDFTRLQNELAAYAVAAQRQPTLATTGETRDAANALLNEKSAAQTPAVATADPRAGIKLQTADAPAQANAAQSTNPPLLQQQTANGLNINGGTLTLNAPAPANTFSVNSNGIITSNQPAPPAAANSFALNNSSNAGPVPLNTSNATQDQSSINRAGIGANVLDSQNTTSPNPALQQAAAKGGPYHVALRPDQLQELAKSFRISLVARGEDAYLFRSTPAPGTTIAATAPVDGGITQTSTDKTPATANPRERADLVRRAGITPPAESAPALIKQSTETPTQPLIDCIITMEPAPAK